MFVKFLLLLPVFLALPSLRVEWADKQERVLRVTMQGQDELVDRCIEGGLEARYRFRMQLCRRRSGWFDTCQERLLEVRSLAHDPISRSYRLTVDRHRDTEEPQVHTITSREEAAEKLATISELPVAYLAQGDSDYMKSRRTYISLRVLSDCKGGYNKTLAGLSYYLTLGLVDVSGFDTGWKSFDLVE